MFRSNVRELARERGLTPADIAAMTPLSLNTAKSWLFGGVFAQINARVVIHLMRVFEIENWQELFEPVIIDAWTGEVINPLDDTIEIE